MAHVPRQIIEEESFAEAKLLIRESARRLDEILEGVTIRLCADAEGGTPVPATALYAIRTEDYPGAPALAVLYQFDEDHVYEVWIELY